MGRLFSAAFTVGRLCEPYRLECVVRVPKSVGGIQALPDLPTILARVGDARASATGSRFMLANWLLRPEGALTRGRAWHFPLALGTRIGAHPPPRHWFGGSDGESVDNFEEFGIQFQLRRLCDELNRDVDAPGAFSTQNHSLEAGKDTALDAAPCTGLQPRIKIDRLAAVQDTLDLPEIRLESLLIRHLQNLRNAVRFQSRFSRIPVPTKEQIAGKQWKVHMPDPSGVGSPMWQEWQEIVDAAFVQNGGYGFLVAWLGVQNPPPPGQVMNRRSTVRSDHTVLTIRGWNVSSCVSHDVLESKQTDPKSPFSADIRRR